MRSNIYCYRYAAAFPPKKNKTTKGNLLTTQFSGAMFYGIKKGSKQKQTKFTTKNTMLNKRASKQTPDERRKTCKEKITKIGTCKDTYCFFECLGDFLKVVRRQNSSLSTGAFHSDLSIFPVE